MESLFYRGYYIVSYDQWDEVDIYDYCRNNHIDTVLSIDEAKKLIDSWITAP